MQRPLSHHDASVPILSVARQFTLSAIALVLLVGNALVVFQPQQLEKYGLYIPDLKFVRDAFQITGMFSVHLPENEDYVLAGKLTQTGLGQERERWIRLSLQDHFPHRHGITTMKIYVARHAVLGTVAVYQARAVLARKIRANHNQLYPGRTVSQIRFSFVRWPKDPQGFRAGMVPGQTKSAVWFIEEPR